jgi:hypothetical protein
MAHEFESGFLVREAAWHKQHKKLKSFGVFVSRLASTPRMASVYIKKFLCFR